VAALTRRSVLGCGSPSANRTQNAGSIPVAVRLDLEIRLGLNWIDRRLVSEWHMRLLEVSAAKAASILPHRSTGFEIPCAVRRFSPKMLGSEDEGVFDRFKPFAKKEKTSELTSLDLCTGPTPQPQSGANAASERQPDAKPAQEAQSSTPPPSIPSCLQVAIDPERTLVLGKDFRRRSEEWMKSGQWPQVVPYLVFPQQGHTLTVSTNDGKKTIVPIFGSTWIAKAYLAAKGIQAVIAACRLYALADQAEKWIAAGINCYALNPCFRCGSSILYPVAELQSEEQFLQTWSFDAITRRLFAEIIVRQCQNQFASNPKGVRDSLERVRDHLDCGMPYLHWGIALLAGMAGDMQANAVAIQRLEEFGPDFVGKLKGDSFHFGEPGSQMATMPEAMMGLLASYGILNLPMKPAAG
jgi:hypothetical protein